MHRTDDDIDLLAADEAIHVVGGSLWFRLIVDLHERHRTSAELAALLLDVEPEAVVDELAEFGEGARVRQHQANF